MGRFIIVLGMFCLMTLSAAAEDLKPLTPKERWNWYLRDSFANPGVLFASAGPALGGQINNKPAAWGQGMSGYSRRLADQFGRFTLANSFEAAGAAALGHEVRYIRASRSGFFPRAGHALAMGFVTKDRDGHWTANISRLGGITGAQLVASRWMPDGYRGPARAMRDAGIEVGAGAAFNLFREFSPELKRIVRKR